METSKQVIIFGVNIAVIPLGDLISKILNRAVNQKKLLVGYANIHALNLAWENHGFKKALNTCDLVFCDGFGVKLGAAILGKQILERFTSPDFIHQLMTAIKESNGSVFLLGAKPGVAEAAALTLQKHTPGLIVSGTAHGYFDKNRNSVENKFVISVINAAKPALLLVGFGMPLQEQWVTENWEELDVPVALMVGALFDTLAGRIPRGPKWMTDHGLEWLARLVIEPHRLWKRYLVGNPLFMWRILKQKFGLSKFQR